MWTRGVPIEDEAKRQLTNVARLPIVFPHVAAMPDVHFRIGATVGSVIPAVKAIIPAAVGVDIGCGMIACKTTLDAKVLPDNLAPLSSAIERAVPRGRSMALLAPNSDERYPDVPAVKELNQHFVIDSPVGLLAPKNLDAKLVAPLTSAFRKTAVDLIFVR
jgi:hypothetical protein